MSLFKCYEHDEKPLDGHSNRCIYILSVYVRVHLLKLLVRNFSLKAKEKTIINLNIKGKYFIGKSKACHTY